jgi:transposase-like protein
VTQDKVIKLAQPGTFSDPLTEILRNGARALLVHAVEAEVAGFLGDHADKLTADGRARLVRHGHLPEREIVTGIGPVAVRCPRVRDRAADGGERIRFSSAILPPYARRSKSLEVLIPILYLKGVSTGDFEEALVALLGKDAGGLSASTIGRLKEAWSDEHARWSKRDLSAKRYVYFWVDGIHVQARLEDEAQCLLVIIGATPEGKKELVGLIDGVRESSQSWKGLLLDLKRRGLSMGPELAVADGALGFWQALEEVWPNTRGQRCWVHKTANVLNKLPKSQQSKAKRALQEIWMAETKKDALAAFDAFVGTWAIKYDQGGRVLDQGSRRAARLLRLPGRALETSAHDQRHRKFVRNSPPPHGAFQGMSFQQDRARHDLQARRSRREKLASPQWPQPVAQNHHRCKVRRRNRSGQTTSSTRCRLTPAITKIRR